MQKLIDNPFSHSLEDDLSKPASHQSIGQTNRVNVHKIIFTQNIKEQTKLQKET